MTRTFISFILEIEWHNRPSNLVGQSVVVSDLSNLEKEIEKYLSIYGQLFSAADTDQHISL